GLGGVSQQRKTTCCFDLVCDPVPIADAFQGDGSSTWQSGEKGGNGSRGVIDANTIEHLATGVLELKLRVVFVSITTDGNCLHDIPPRGAQSPTSDSSAQGGAVILSNRCSCPLGGRAKVRMQPGNSIKRWVDAAGQLNSML